MADFQIGLQIEAQHMQNLFGSHDAYIKQIENDLHVIITDRNGSMSWWSFPGEGTGYRSRTYRTPWSFPEMATRMRSWRWIRSVFVTR